MKATAKSLVSAFLAAVMAVMMFACADKGTAQPPVSGTNPPQEAGELDIVIDGSSDFAIVRPDSEAAAAEIKAAVSLNKAFEAATGKLLTITTDWEKSRVYEYELCVGELKRNGTFYNVDASSLAENEFTVRVSGSRVILVGNNSYGTSKAVEWFIAEYLTAEDGSIKTLSVPADLSYTGTFEVPQNIRIMTQNLLATDTEYAGVTTVDPEKHTIAARQPRILSLITTYKPDSMGVQECSDQWRKYFDAKLYSIGYARIGAQKNQKIGIIYNTATLKPVKIGSFWLTEKPESLKISVEWSEGVSTLTERLGMYVVFECITTGKLYIHFNTHLETSKNSVIQTKQTEVLLQYISTVGEMYNGAPVVLTGDFNYNLKSAPYKTLVSKTLGDTRKLAADSAGEGSFNKFIGKSYSSLPIDQIVATADGFVFNRYRVIYDTFDGCFASDHYAVYSDMEIR